MYRPHAGGIRSVLDSIQEHGPALTGRGGRGRAEAAEARTGELETRVADLNNEVEREHADLEAERRRAGRRAPAHAMGGVGPAPMEGAMEAFGVGWKPTITYRNKYGYDRTTLR